MAKEEITNAEKALKGISKEHEKLHELALQPSKTEEKEEEESLEEEISRPLPQSEFREVRKDFNSHEGMTIKASQVGLEESVAPAQPIVQKEEEEDKSKGYTPKRSYETTGNFEQTQRKRDYDPVNAAQPDFQIRAARLQSEQIKDVATQGRQVQNFIQQEGLAPLEKDVSTYVESKRMEHEKFDKEKMSKRKDYLTDH
ncbi:hypothetical protein ACFLZZ_03165 [Nanoarchaeota archaeon]